MERLKLIRKENNDGYSVYENPDKELVERIKAYPIPNEFNYYMFHTGKARLVEFNAKGKAIITNDDGDLATIDADDYHEYLREEHLRQINIEYRVCDTFNRYFSPYSLRNSVISVRSDFGRSLICHSEEEHANFDRVFENINFYDGVNGIFDTEEFQFYKDYHGNFQLILTKRGSSGHMYFTKDGEIKNRDYNLDLNWYGELTTKEAEVEKFLANFLQYSEFTFEYANNTWYTPEFCFKAFVTNDYSRGGISVGKYFFNGKVYKSESDSSYKIKKPKREIMGVTGGHIIDRLKELIETFDYEYK